jgi:hypothetical protein
MRIIKKTDQNLQYAKHIVNLHTISSSLLHYTQSMKIDELRKIIMQYEMLIQSLLQIDTCEILDVK